MKTDRQPILKKFARAVLAQVDQAIDDALDSHEVPDGSEAEELRSRIEALRAGEGLEATNCEGGYFYHVTDVDRALQAILDEVDARDSSTYLSSDSAQLRAENLRLESENAALEEQKARLVETRLTDDQIQAIILALKDAVRDFFKEASKPAPKGVTPSVTGGGWKALHDNDLVRAGDVMLHLDGSKSEVSFGDLGHRVGDVLRSGTYVTINRRVSR
jgi:hypothetical protein